MTKAPSRWVVRACLIVASFLFCFLLLLGIDLFLHWYYRDLSGINIRGYRGPVAGAKLPGEFRVVVLGGSTVFGFGGKPWESFPAQMEKRLNALDPNHRFRVINLGWSNEGAYSFRWTLQDYDYLDYDLAVFYEGYNDLALNTYVFRHNSPVFLLTGYFPLLPLYLREQADFLGGVERFMSPADRQGHTIFRFHMALETTKQALELASRVSDSLEKQLGKLSKPAHWDPKASAPSDCKEPWVHYCQSIETALHIALDGGHKALVVTQPIFSDKHIEQQQAMLGMLRADFTSHPRLFYVNLGNAIDLNDKRLCGDGLHLSAEGNGIIADHLVEPVLAAAQQ